MRIADVSGFYSERGGGVKSYVNQKLALAAAWGHAVTIIAPGEADRVEPREGQGRIVWIKSPPMPGDANYRLIFSRRAVWAALEEARPDVVEGSSTWRGGWLAGAWPGRAPRALVFHQDFVAAYAHTALDGLLSHDAIDGLFAPYWAYARALSRRFDVTVAGGEWLADRLRRLGLKNPVAIPLGLEAGRFSPSLRDEVLRTDLLAKCGVGPDGKLLLSVGRFHPEKRYGAIIGGFARARAVRSDLGLVIIGDGLARRAVERQARDAGGVFLAGAVGDRDWIARAYASADALVHGSAAETYGLVVAEALASGLLVVAPDAGGASDLARDGGSELYRAGDAAACGRAILALLERGRRTGPPAANASAEQHFSRLFDLYERLATREITSPGQI